MDNEGFEILSLCNSENIFRISHNAGENQIIVQFKKGLARYKYSNITQAMVDHMKSLSEGLGSYIRKTISGNPAAYPVEKLD